MRYFTYFKYLFTHKWYVFLATFKVNVPIWIGIFHDWDKFLPEMIIAYANFFYNQDGSNRRVRDENGYYNPAITGNARFDKARFMHLARNKHHWQYWTALDDYKQIVTLDMPDIYIREMLADWQGAHTAQGSKGTISEWYHLHKDTMTLSYDTQRRIEAYLVEFNL